ncbi:MAG TPA: mechanosensitive ion channel family protein [Candidatus Dormibacteraeota bacterium]|nr:mechanosensitive ion channel family protein [Candidatus Dormibacteraeota bacterium]
MKLPKDLQDAVLQVLRDDVLPILVVIVLALVIIRLVAALIHRIVKAILDRESTEGTAQELSAVEVRKRMQTVETMATQFVAVFVVLIGGITILAILGLNIGPAIAGLGIVGIAVGFGAQSLVRDYFNGALILLENQFSKGDVVRIAGVAGTVEDFSLRRTTLRDLEGIVHTVPNGQITVTSNLTRTWGRINQDVTIAYGTDIDRAISIVDEVGRTLAADPVWRRRVLEPPRVERVEALGEYGITLKVLGNVRAADRWAAAGEFRKRLLEAFAANGIQLPRPARVVLAAEAPNAAPAGAPSQEDLAAGTE